MTDHSTLPPVLFNKFGYQHLNEIFETRSFSKVFVLVDTHTHANCLPSFVAGFNAEVDFEVIEIEHGEENKNIETCTRIWSVLSELGADRKSLLINLGGGVLTDLGGFVGATFRRGISFIHVPTTLLAMVDAAIGGKNGINLGNLKNQVGVIHSPEAVLVDTSFLGSLPPAEMRSGLAEMLKHGLISDEAYWNKLASLDQLTTDDLDTLIEESIAIKQDIVRKDPNEQHIRKTLNFGHTLGHAIESFFLERRDRQKLLHGEAVAIGMILAAHLSAQAEDFPNEQLVHIKKILLSLYGKIPIERAEQEKIIELLKFDKKNEAGKINFVLLRRIGEPVLDRQVNSEKIYKAFDYYLD